MVVETRTVETRDGSEEIELEPADDLPAGIDEDADALAELDEMGGAGARYEVRRTSPAPFTGYVGTYPRDQFSPDRLFSEWGGGNYTIRVRGTNGQMIGSKQLQLAGNPHHKAEPAVQHAAPAQGGSLVGELAPVLAAMQKSSESQISLLTSLVTGLINKPAPVLPPAPDPLAMIAALKDVLAPAKGDTGGDAVKLLLQGLELGKELAGGGGESSMADVALKGFDTLKELAAVTAPATPAPRKPAAPPAAAPGTVPAQVAPPNKQPAAPPAQGAPVNPNMAKLQWLKQQTVALCGIAARDKDPALYAEVFLDNLPETFDVQEVLTQMQTPGAIDRLALLNPNVKKFAAWFEEFRQEVIALLTDVDDPVERTGDEGEVVSDPEGGAIIDADPTDAMSDSGEGS